MHPACRAAELREGHVPAPACVIRATDRPRVDRGRFVDAAGLAGTIVDNPLPGTGKRFSSSVATVGAYDATLGTFVEHRVAIGSDGGVGSLRVRDAAGGWELFHQEAAHPE
jgi:hypothetical protein